MRHSSLAVAAVAALSLFATSCSGGKDSGESYFGAVEHADAVSVVRASDGKAFFVDYEGHEIAGPFDALGEIHDGRILFRSGVDSDTTVALYGYVDDKGKTVIPASYASASDFSEGVAFVAPRDSSLRAIDRSGNVLFTVPDAVTVNVFSGGYAQASDIEGRLWLIDRKGQRIDFPDSVSSAGFVDNGYVVGRVGDARRLYRVENGSISLVSSFERFSLQAFDAKSGVAIVRSGDNYLLASSGEDVKGSSDYTKLKFDGRYICYRNAAGKIGFLDSKGDVVIEAAYDDVRFNGGENADGFFIVSRDGRRWEIINSSGKTVIPADFDRIMYLTGSLFAVAKEGKVGIADASREKVVCQPQYSDVTAVGRVLFASTGSGYAVVSDEGKMLSPEIYAFPEAVYHDFAETQTLSTAQRADMIRMIMGNVAFGVPMPELAERYGLDSSLYNSQPGEWPLAQGAVPGMEFILVGGFNNGPVVGGRWNPAALPDSYVLVAYFPDARAAMDVVGLLTSDPDWVVDSNYGSQALSDSPAIRFTLTPGSPSILIAPEPD